LGGIRKWLQEGIVIEAEGKLRAAYRSRGKAMAILWKIDRLHHEDSRRNQCTCGRPTQQCREFQAVAPILDALDAWEKRELELLKKGSQHELPLDHPAVLKSRSRGWAA
jgi:hypothetical protein